GGGGGSRARRPSQPRGGLRTLQADRGRVPVLAALDRSLRLARPACNAHPGLPGLTHRQRSDRPRIRTHGRSDTQRWLAGKVFALPDFCTGAAACGGLSARAWQPAPPLAHTATSLTINSDRGAATLMVVMPTRAPP